VQKGDRRVNSEAIEKRLLQAGAPFDFYEIGSWQKTFPSQIETSLLKNRIPVFEIKQS
jgi:hypothetical protein